MRVGGCVGGPFCGEFPSSAGWLMSCDFGKVKGRGGEGWVKLDGLDGLRGMNM